MSAIRSIEIRMNADGTGDLLLNGVSWADQITVVGVEFRAPPATPRITLELMYSNLVMKVETESPVNFLF